MRREDIKQVLTALGAKQFIDSGESVQTNCVLAKWTHEHGTDRRPSMGIKEDQGMSYFHCFTCNKSGGLMTLVREYGKYALPEGLITQERIKELVDFIFIAEDEEVTVTPDIVDIPAPPDYILSALGIQHEYFQSRGITDELFKQWNLGYHDATQRAMFPVYQGKEIVGIVGRSIINDAIKWKNYPAKFKKSHCLIGLHLKAKQSKLIIVEGPIDTIKVNEQLKEYEDYWCVGILGAEPSKAQMDLMVENADEIILMLDNDSSGKRGQKTILDYLGKRAMLSIVNYPEGIKDPDEAGEKVIDMVMYRVTALDWQLKNLLRRVGHG